jgi:hypothetical protein
MRRTKAGDSAGSKPREAGALPKLTISIRSETKAKLEALSTLTQQPVWRVVDDALNKAFGQLGPKDRHAIDTMAKRIHDRAGEGAPSTLAEHDTKRRSKI